MQNIYYLKLFIFLVKTSKIIKNERMKIVFEQKNDEDIDEENNFSKNTSFANLDMNHMIYLDLHNENQSSTNNFLHRLSELDSQEQTKSFKMDTTYVFLENEFDSIFDSKQKIFDESEFEKYQECIYPIQSCSAAQMMTMHSDQECSVISQFHQKIPKIRNQESNYCVIDMQKKHFNHLHDHSYSLIMEKYSSSESVDESSINQNSLYEKQLKYISDHDKFIESNEKKNFKSPDSEKNFLMFSKQEEQNKNFCRSTISRHIRSGNHRSYFNKLMRYLDEISYFFTLQKIDSKNDYFSAVSIDLKKFLKNKIDMMENTSIYNQQKENRSIRPKIIQSISNLKSFCPFCLDEEIDLNDIEKKFVSHFPLTKLYSKLTHLINQLFEQISISYESPFTPERLFNCKFFENQRIVLKKILHFVESNIILFGDGKRIKYLHVEYHKLLMHNLDIKMYFLPEFQSIMYVLQRTTNDYFAKQKNTNFMILFYFFYSLNKFFDWITEYCRLNKIVDTPQLEGSFLRFVSESITFVLRVYFIQCIFSQFNIHLNAQLRYHFLVQIIYHDEIQIYLQENNANQKIAINSKELIPMVILLEKYTVNFSFEFLLEFAFNLLIYSDLVNLNNFGFFLKHLAKTTNLYLSSRSHELENSLKKYFSNADINYILMT